MQRLTLIICVFACGYVVGCEMNEAKNPHAQPPASDAFTITVREPQKEPRTFRVERSANVLKGSGDEDHTAWRFVITRAEGGEILFAHPRE